MLGALVHSALSRCALLLLSALRMLGVVRAQVPAVDVVGTDAATPAVSGHVETGDGEWQITLADPLENASELKSRESRHSLFIRFENRTEEFLSKLRRRGYLAHACRFASSSDQAVRLFWLDYSGKQVRYKTIEVGRSHRQQSFLSHPWTAATVIGVPQVRLACNGQPAIYPLADSEEPLAELTEDDTREAMVVRIEWPPLRVWSPTEHAHFPDVFRQAVRALVLCHAHLAADADSPCQRRAYTLGCLPIALRDVLIALAAPKVPFWQPVRMPRPETPDAE